MNGTRHRPPRLFWVAYLALAYGIFLEARIITHIGWNLITILLALCLAMGLYITVVGDFSGRRLDRLRDQWDADAQGETSPTVE